MANYTTFEGLIVIKIARLEIYRSSFLQELRAARAWTESDPAHVTTSTSANAFQGRRRWPQRWPECQCAYRGTCRRDVGD